MTRKTFVLDTNVLLHDPNALEKFVDNDVVLPLSMLEELDKKSKNSNELGKNALSVLRYIRDFDSNGDLFQGVLLKNGVRFSVLKLQKPERGDFPLAFDQHKNFILYAAHVLQKEARRVVVVSKDFLFRLRAKAIGLHAEDYLSLKESYESLYKGLRRRALPKAEIDKIYMDGFIEAPDEALYPNEYCILACPENTQCVTKYDAKRQRLEPISQLTKDVWGLTPLNEEQTCALDLLLRDDIKLVTLVGQAGTGKTLLALTAGLRKVFDEDVYKRILVSRPIMPLGKDIGFLPGTKEDKVYHWMQPIYDNLDFLCENTAGEENVIETKNWIIDSQRIEMEAVTYIRGRSLSNTYIIIDEAQNLTPHEVKTIVSRAGKGTKVILTGDPTQIDNPYLDKDSNAMTYVINKFKQYPIFGHIFLEKTERSELAALAADVL